MGFWSLRLAAYGHCVGISNVSLLAPSPASGRRCPKGGWGCPHRISDTTHGHWRLLDADGLKHAQSGCSFMQGLWFLSIHAAIMELSEKTTLTIIKCPIVTNIHISFFMIQTLNVFAWERLYLMYSLNGYEFQISDIHFATTQKYLFCTNWPN